MTTSADPKALIEEARLIVRERYSVDWLVMVSAIDRLAAALEAEMTTRQKAEAELATWHAKCDEVGISHDPSALVDHHRGNAMAAGAAQAMAESSREQQELADKIEALAAELDAQASLIERIHSSANSRMRANLRRDIASELRGLVSGDNQTQERDDA